LRRVFSFGAVLVAASVIAASVVSCGSSDDDAASGGAPPASANTAKPPITLDELETELLGSLDDQPVIVPEAVLDQDFPLVEMATTSEDEPDRDPTKGSDADLDAAFAAFTTTEVADDHFTIDVLDAAVPAPLVERVKKGILFGLANRDAFIPGFSVMAATNKKTGGKPFFVSIKTTDDPTLGSRPFVRPCGGTLVTSTPAERAAAIEAGNCIPRVTFTSSAPTVTSFTPHAFIHEMAHISQQYWEQSAEYVSAGGVKLASAYNQGFTWQHESDAQFTSRHGPESRAYGIFPRCPFEPLRRGAVAWKSLTNLGDDRAFPYEMSILLDQITWHRFGKDPA
jgi:hypothetical protein